MRQTEPDKPVNHERWIISYADFTTLLLATFVVMYAVSSINSSKFQEMAEAFSTAFIGRVVSPHDAGLAAAEKSPFAFLPSPVHVPIITRQVKIKDLPIATTQDDPERETPHGRSDASGNPAHPGHSRETSPPPPEAQAEGQTPGENIVVPPTGLPVTLPELREQIEQRVQSLDLAFEKLKAALAPLIGNGQVRVSLQSLGVVVDINEVLLFNSGKAELTPQALPLIDEIAAILKGLPYQIQVNGFSDNKPIHNAQFDSNWDLSALRAISVVKRFVAAGIDPSLLVGAGFGEYHPIAPNTSPEKMAMNRRVSVVVVSPIRRDSPLKTPLVGSPQARGAAAAPPAAPGRP